MVNVDSELKGFARVNRLRLEGQATITEFRQLDDTTKWIQALDWHVRKSARVILPRRIAEDPSLWLPKHIDAEADVELAE